MTLHLNVIRRRVAHDAIVHAIYGQAHETDAPSHEVVCNDCGTPQVFEAIPAVRFELPYPWLDLGDDKHRGPCCQTKAARERRRRNVVATTVRELRDMGFSYTQIRSSGLLA